MDDDQNVFIDRQESFCWKYHFLDADAFGILTMSLRRELSFESLIC